MNVQERNKAQFQRLYDEVIIEFMVAEDDKVTAIGTVEGTHQGDFFGMPATGKHFNIRNIDICRFNAEGKIAEHWGLIDRATMLPQLS